MPHAPFTGDDPTPDLVRPYVGRRRGEEFVGDSGDDEDLLATHDRAADADRTADAVAAPGPASQTWQPRRVETPTVETPMLSPTGTQSAPRSGRRVSVVVGVAAVLLVVVAIVVVAALAPGSGRTPAAESSSAETSDGPTDPANTPTLPEPTSPGRSAQATPDPAPSVPSASPQSAPTPTPPTANRTGPIVSAQNDRCVALSDEPPAEGTAVHTAGCDGSPGQTWSIMADGTIRSGSTWCLAPADGSVAANTGTVVGACNGGAIQQWRVLADSQMLNLVSGLCLTRPGGNPKAQLTITTCADATGQKWTAP